MVDSSSNAQGVNRTAHGRRRPTRPKIHDVAELAGVSTKTVSRVLNKEKYVRPETRDKVLAAVKTLDYTPDFSARSLAGQKSYMLALFYGSVSPAYLAKFQAGVIDQCSQSGYHVLVESMRDDNPDNGRAIAETAAQTRVDGVILVPPLSDHQGIITALDEIDIPYVLVAPTERSSRAPSVNTDNFEAARQLVHHLIAMGHTDIAVIKGPPNHSATPLRYAGYRTALKESGIEFDPSLEAEGDFQTESGRVAAMTLLNRDTRPTAIFASNDDMAAGAQRSAADLGIQIPDDLSIVGFDDSLVACIASPPLTTVRQPIEEMARGAVDLLIGDRSDEDPALPPPHRNFDFELVFRESAARLISR